jgi:hypothetical protein
MPILKQGGARTAVRPYENINPQSLGRRGGGDFSNKIFYIISIDTFVNPFQSPNLQIAPVLQL